VGVSDLISGIVARMGVDPRGLKTLLGVYLKQDLRRSRDFRRTGGREAVTSNRSLVGVVVLYAVMGLAVGVYVVTGMDVFVYSTVACSYTMVIVALAAVAESGNVIFNEAEADVLGHLPISSRTLFAAKVINLLLFTMLLTAAANFFPSILGAWAGGANRLFFLAHFFSATLLAFFATSLVVLCYGLLMRFVARQRFDSIIAYCQAALTLAFMLGFQLLPRIVDLNQRTFLSELKWYYLLFPPAWFSSITVLMMGRVDNTTVVLTTIAIGSLTVTGWAGLRKVAAGYSSFAAGLSQSSSPKAPAIAPAIAPAGSYRRVTADAARRTERLKSLILRSRGERAIFDLISTYLRRDREVKIRLYPSLGYFVAFPLLGLLSAKMGDPFIKGAQSFYGILGASMICFVSLTTVEGLVFSDHFPASFVFGIAPRLRVGDIHNGVRKAVLCFISFPGFVVLLFLYSVLWKNPVHAFLLLVPWLLVALPILQLASIGREVLPLSRKYQKGQQSARTITILCAFTGVGLVIGALQTAGIRGRYHYFWFILSCVVATVVVHRVTARSEARALKHVDDVPASSEPD
jgi:ABC-2 type transport system permease protein